MVFYDYENATAFDPYTREGAPNTSGQVYDRGDVAFENALTVELMSSGLSVAELQTDAYCQIPGFRVDNLTQVVFKSGTFTKVLTTSTPLPGPAGPAVADAIDNGDGTVSFKLTDGTMAATLALPVGEGPQGERGPQGLPATDAAQDDAALVTFATTSGTRFYSALRDNFAGADRRGDSWRTAWRDGSVEVLRAWYRANTGPRIPIDPTPITGEVAIASQADADAIRGKQINGHILINASDVELSDFVLKGDGSTHLILVAQSVVRVKIHDFEVDGQDNLATVRGLNSSSATSTAGNGVIMERGNFHRLCDGFMASAGGVYQYNWVHDPLLWDVNILGPYTSATDPHSDGIQMSSGVNVTIARNFVEMVGTDPNIISAIMLNSASNPVDKITISENYLAGGGYTIHMLDDGYGNPTNVTLRANRFGGGYNVGLFNIGTATPTFDGNVWADTGEAIPTANGAIDRHNPVREDDPLGMGYAATYLAVGSAQAWGGANEARFLRVLTPGTVKRIALEVLVSSGNISVGVYRGTGDKFSRKPGTRLASATVPCPAVGVAYIDLGATVDVQAGDYLAMSCDNTTASFNGFTGSASLLFGGQFYRATASHPLPGPAPTVSAGGYRMPILAGVI